MVNIRTYVNGSSMSPTLNTTYNQTKKRDIVYINRFAKCEIGDIVILDVRNVVGFGDYAIKRLIAKEGDVVNIEINASNNTYDLTVNKQLVYSKPYQAGLSTYVSFNAYVLNHQQDNSRISRDGENKIQGIIIKRGEIFVLGDNWEGSKDSATVGPFSAKTLVGKVKIIVKPNQNEFLTVLKRIF